MSILIVLSNHTVASARTSFHRMRTAHSREYTRRIRKKRNFNNSRNNTRNNTQISRSIPRNSIPKVYSITRSSLPNSVARQPQHSSDFTPRAGRPYSWHSLMWSIDNIDRSHQLTPILSVQGQQFNNSKLAGQFYINVHCPNVADSYNDIHTKLFYCYLKW